MNAATEKKLKEIIRNVPDFPKPGILFKDITPILADYVLCNDIVDEFYDHFKSHKIDAVIGVESRGFLFGMMMAQKFRIPFISVRKAGKLPYKTISYEYNLEYGTAKIEMHTDAIQPGWRVLIHDDLLATGGTAAAAAELVKKLNGEVAGFAFVIELAFLNGNQVLGKYSPNIFSLTTF